MVRDQILVADNDRAVSSLLGEILRRQGLVVQQAFDGEQAKAMLLDPRIAVLVCDLDMPKVSGLEVIQWLQQQPSPPDVLVISGYVDASVTASLRSHVCVREILRKPFDLMKFARAVQQLAKPVATDLAAEQS
jgi:CheY-like chemotaxis protein